MDTAMKTLSTKLTQLKITTEKTSSVLQTGNSGRIERHMEALKSLIINADEARRSVEEIKIEESDNVQEIQEWSEKIDEEISRSDVEVAQLRDWLAEAKDFATAKNRKEELDFQKELFETKLNYQKELEKSQATNIIGMQTAGSADSSGVSAAKLPKIVITPFDGSYQDWTRWWGQ